MNPSYFTLNAEADYRTAADHVLHTAKHELLIFDRDLTALRLEEAQRRQLLAEFISVSPTRRIRIVVHDPLPAQQSSPRLMQLLEKHAHAITCRQSPDHLRTLADSHLIADIGNGVRRFHFDQPRSALILNDPGYLQPWRLRFEELWNFSAPCLVTKTTGL